MQTRVGCYNRRVIRPCPACSHGESTLAESVRTDTFGDLRVFERRECVRCRMIFVHPLPTEADLAALYASPNYYELTATEPTDPAGFRVRPEWKQAEYARILDQLGRRIPPPARALDVGCGWGLFIECAQARGYAAEGLDPSPEVVAYVTGKLGLAARVAKLEDAEPGAYDLLTMLDVFEHVPDPRGFAEQAKRALKPGGWLGIRVPRWGGISNHLMHRLLTALRRDAPMEFLQHLSEFRPGSLTTVLGSAGFVEIAVIGSENPLRYYTKPWLKRQVWNAISLSGRLTGRTDSLLAFARKPPA